MTIYSIEDAREFPTPGFSDVENLAEMLNGTCYCLDIAGMTDEEQDELFTMIDVCQTCGWWHDTWQLGEKDGELVCDDCGENDDDE